MQLRDPATAATTLVFDVVGTLLDEDGTRTAALRSVGSDLGVDLSMLGDRWAARVDAAVAEVTAGRAPYQPPAAFYRSALTDLLRADGTELPPDRFDELARFGYRLEPFPDTAPALERLARGRALVALTNAGCGQAFAMSAQSGLRWTTLISGESVGAYKPDPRMYRHAIGTLDLDPGRTLFVAAHDWDLDAAAQHGFRTAYVDRSGGSTGDLAGYAHRFDLVVTDLDHLADALGR
ncbi:haloacid dehalogenase type II [Actinoplanes sp. NPDC049802]|uniref:haloacid dehalogenase type II n=1 Tax=Actinoplanes sp. NPDC049802 TaxID=3154742 RepID=UPI0033D2A4CB